MTTENGFYGSQIPEHPVYAVQDYVLQRAQTPSRKPIYYGGIFSRALAAMEDNERVQVAAAPKKSLLANFGTMPDMDKEAPQLVIRSNDPQHSRLYIAKTIGFDGQHFEPFTAEDYQNAAFEIRRVRAIGALHPLPNLAPDCVTITPPIYDDAV